MQLGNITETHLVDNMLDPPVVNARPEPGCPDRSRDFPAPIVSTPPTLLSLPQLSLWHLLDHQLSQVITLLNITFITF